MKMGFNLRVESRLILHFNFLSFVTTVGTVLNCQSGRIPETFQHELHCRTKAIQQLAHGAPS
jgi:hypothetical protein